MDSAAPGLGFSFNPPTTHPHTTTTPQVDEAVRAELLRSPLFQRMDQGVDEDEHSIEMHLPYVAQVEYLGHTATTDRQCASHQPTNQPTNQPNSHEPNQAVKGRGGVTVVPIMVGAIDPEQEAEYGQALAPYLEDPANFFIIRSVVLVRLLFPFFLPLYRRMVSALTIHSSKQTPRIRNLAARTSATGAAASVTCRTTRRTGRRRSGTTWSGWTARGWR